jgi:3-ketosteroid 9alpha-monooxygenase subunit B
VPDPSVRRDHGFHTLAVKRIVQETADTRSLALDVPAELRDTFSYQPGQFCTFRIPVGDDPPLRCYSMSSAPETDEDLTVTVKRVPGGVGSNWLHDALAEGDTVQVTKPAGVFCVRDQDRPIVAFCGGSGITPVMSIIRSVLASGSAPIRLLYANRDAGSVIFEDALSELQQVRPDHLQVQHHIDADGGYLDREAVAAFIGTDLHAHFFICGPGPFMDLVETTLLDLGVDPDRIAIERFQNADQDLISPSDTVPEADQSGGSITLIVRGKTTTIDHRPGDTVLGTARRAGVTTPYSCEAGNCATCMAMLREGTVSLRANNALTAEELEEGWILTCQAEPTSPSVTIEFEDL